MTIPNRRPPNRRPPDRRPPDRHLGRKTQHDKRRAYLFGRHAETIAEIFLRLKGYRILARRWRTPLGEIDLIARRRRVTVFVEIKGRSQRHQSADPVSLNQQRRIRRAAQLWCAGQASDSTYFCRFDVILIAPRRWPRHIEDAFR